ncbi:pilus assembly protein TadG-related protein [Burkholderia multivorans]|uniref:pilus assembly protein TadG-related protein n=1 Tax=Burkholderia multivorans TaxID=87883 RepID=UPI0021C1EE8F|nr:pilus assembly protein TadG-related protein [Burkholderia multivorans]
MRVDHLNAAGRRGADQLGRRCQRGSISVMAAIWVLAAIVVLGAIDIGNLYFQKRDVQRIADMAALAAVQPMASDPNGCQAPAHANVRVNALSNDANSPVIMDGAPPSELNVAAGKDQIYVTCGQWDPSTAYVTPAPSIANAAQVTVYRKVNYFFLGLLNSLSGREAVIRASATARATNIDSFSVSAGVLSAGGDCESGSAPTGSVGLLDMLLTSLLGAGSQLNLSVGCYNALAGANIKLGDLAAALNVGTPKGLVNTTVKLSDLLNASLTALNENAAASANVAAANTALSLIIRSLNVSVGNTPVTVINPNQAAATPAQSGAISLGVPPGQNADILANAATQATVDLLDLIMASAAIANAQSAALVSLSTSQLAALGFPPGLVNLKLQILTPPSPVVGEAGKLNGKYRTQATNGQIGVSFSLALPTIDLGIASISGLNLPLYLVVGGPATANLEAIDCEASTSANPSWVTISVTPGIASVCVGNAPTTSAGWLNLASNNNCSGTATSVAAQVLGLSLVTLPVSSTGPIITLGAGNSSSSQGSSSPAFYSNTANPPQFCVKSDASQDCPTYWTTNSNALGSQIVNLNALSVGPLAILGVELPIQRITPAVAVVLQPILDRVVPLLNSILVPVLNLLGAQIGQATVHQIGLTCGTPQLVY